MSTPRKILIGVAIGIIIISIMLVRPTAYQINVHNSRYYGGCEIITDNKCVTIEPPDVIYKREPFVQAWWHKLQIQRTYSLKEVTTK